MNMTPEEMNTQLYEKLTAEQAKYRDWLMGQPPEEMLNHAYEYAVREDILAAAELMDMPQAQAAALLAVSSPMEAIYGEWTERKSSDLDPMLDCISNRAYAALQAQRELPVYRYPGGYAHEHGELEQYRASRKADIACKEAIESAITEHYRDNAWAGKPSPRWWSSSAMSGCFTSLPIRSGIKSGTGGFPKATRRGPGRFPSLRTWMLGGMTATKSLSWTAAIPVSSTCLWIWCGMSIC